MKRTIVLLALVISLSGMASASNGQAELLVKEIEDMTSIITSIQGDLDHCGERDTVCAEIAASADAQKDLTETALEKAKNRQTEDAMEDLKEVRKMVRADIETLEDHDRSDDGTLSTVLTLEYELEKKTNKALRRANTLGVINTTKDCPEKCGPAVSAKAQEAQDYNSSRSNKPRS